MSLSLPPELNQWVQQKIESGVYSSEEAVLRAALSALDDREETVVAIQEGYEDFQAGRFRGLEEADRDFRQKHQIKRDP